MTLTYEQALNRASALCSKGEHCASDIQKKATDWGLSPDEADRLVKRLREEHFIDDARFVHAFVHDKYEYQRWGRMKIRYTLLQKHLPSSLIDNTLDEVIGKEDYEEALLALLRTRMRNMPLPLSQNNRAKLFRFALQRGYEMGVVNRALRELNMAVEDD